LGTAHASISGCVLAFPAQEAW